MEHNSNYVPWYALCREILPRLGRRVEYRLARFDPDSGELDLDHLASLIDSRTKLVCCIGASNFLGTRNPLGTIRALADASGYLQQDGERRSYLLVNAAQLVPGSFVDVQALDVDYLAFSFHKIMAPFGVGVLYAKEHLLRSSLPFLYGGDMIAEGRVFPWQVEYNALPWKYTAGTPNILGAIISAQALRILLDLALTPNRPVYFGTAAPIGRAPCTPPWIAFPAGISSSPAGHSTGSARSAGSPSTGPGSGAAHVAGRVQPGRPGSSPRGPGPEPGRGGVPRGCHCATLAITRSLPRAVEPPGPLVVTRRAGRWRSWWRRPSSPGAALRLPRSPGRPGPARRPASRRTRAGSWRAGRCWRRRP